MNHEFNESVPDIRTSCIVNVICKHFGCDIGSIIHRKAILHTVKSTAISIKYLRDTKVNLISVLMDEYTNYNGNGKIRGN